MSTVTKRKTISVTEFIDFVYDHIWCNHEDEKKQPANETYFTGPWFPMFVQQLQSDRKSICLNFPDPSEMKLESAAKIYGSILAALKVMNCKSAGVRKEFTKNGYYLYIYDREEMLTRFK